MTGKPAADQATHPPPSMNGAEGCPSAPFPWPATPRLAQPRRTQPCQEPESKRLAWLTSPYLLVNADVADALPVRCRVLDDQHLPATLPAEDRVDFRLLALHAPAPVRTAGTCPT